MSALQVVEEIDRSGLDPLVARLDDILAELRAAIDDPSEVADAERIDRISALERLRGATAALQLAECVRFGQSQVAEQLAADVHPKAIGRGVADQIALACRISPFSGSRRLGVARALWFDLPHTCAALAAGELSEQRAETVVTETRHLDGPTRRAVDSQVIAAGLATMGTRSATACIRRHAYAADPQGYLDRGRTERKNRRVGLRPAPDTMAILTGYLPVEQGVACYAALRQQTDATVADGDPRTRDQTCRDAYCDAAIRHLDHVSGWAAGGSTTLANGRGTCARGNYVREMTGWRVEVVDRGQQDGPHTTVTTTPTGHHYLSRAPVPP